MATILDGKKLSEQILAEIEKEVKGLAKRPRLAIVLVGNDPASRLYVGKKKEMGERLGIDVRLYEFPIDISTKKLRAEVGRICKLPGTSGVIVQLPLPKNVNTRSVLNAVTPDKDVDVLSERASGALYTGHTPVLPPTVAGIVHLLDANNLDVQGNVVALVGFGKLVGKPATFALAQRGATLLVLNEYTQDLGSFTRQADVVIAGVGKPGLITADMIKEGAVLLDAGDAQIDGKTTGDISPDAYEKSSYYTPVPGGIGPMTVAMLFKNLVMLASQTRNRP
ncbi:MAG: bifunctional 5,10-methylenetetrahydrofolate dehydrogenase/5,10-methenyltetrahydrofolate cyclohydrolase [Candidatus Spechtbacterales bacterium]